MKNVLKNKKSLLAILAIAFAFMLIACGNNDSGSNDTTDNGEDDAPVSDVPTEGEGTARDYLVIASAGNVNTMDIHGTNDVNSSQVHRHVFSTLVIQDHNLEIQPGLAVDWRQIDDRVWEFDLQEGVLFHNGDVLTAYDVAFSFTRAADAGQIAPILGMIDPDTIEIIDDTTIRIGTRYPFGPFLNHVAHPASGILNASVVGDYEPGEANESNIDIVGTGPYRFVEMVADSHLILERFDDYHGDAPNIREIRFNVFTDPSARTTAAETGAVDIMMSPFAADLNRLFDNNNMHILEVPGLGSDYMGMQVTFPGLDDVRVRQAINYAVDTQIIVDVAFEGWSPAGETVIAASVFGHHPGISAREQNIERARELMEEAGFNESNPLVVTITTNGENLNRRAMAEMMQNKLAEVHIDASMEIMEFGAFMEARDNGELEMFIAGWIAVTGDADYAMFPLFHSSNHGASGNQTWFNNARVDELLEAARSTSDQEARLAYYHEAQEIIHEEAPWVILNQNYVYVVSQSNVRGLYISPTQSHFFGDIYFVD